MGTQVVWECRTDPEKFFFPPTNFNTSVAPAMLSCATLATGESRLGPQLSVSGAAIADDGSPVAKRDRFAGQEEQQGTNGVDTPPKAAGSWEPELSERTADGEGHGKQGHSSESDGNAKSGVNLMRPFVINLDEEVMQFDSV